MAAQATREERLAAADHVIENDGSLDALRVAVDRLWHEVLAPAAAAARGAQGT
jgi:dephospho-CoA kinase